MKNPGRGWHEQAGVATSTDLKRWTRFEGNPILLNGGPGAGDVPLPRAGLLRYRSLLAARELEADDVADVGPVYRACERLRPFLDWLAEHTTVIPEDLKAAGSPG